MNHETQLKIQAHLDGELPAAEQPCVAELLRADEEARTLYESLSATRTILAENEPRFTLPESREFYWSKIERAIRSEASARERAQPSVAGWKKWWVAWAVPAGVMALLAALIFSPPFGAVNRNSDWSGVEMPLEESSSITFHSETENMTVVWVQSR